MLTFQLGTCIFLMSALTSSSHRSFGLPTGLLLNGFHEYRLLIDLLVSLRWPRDTLYPLKLELTSPTSGGRSVGIVRLRTKATELFVVVGWHSLYVAKPWESCVRIKLIIF
jgi:hypothetical protein